MAFSAAGIVKSFQVYYDNPTAKRDFRAQLRGNKALWLWSVYLALLFAVAYFVYDNIQRNGNVMSVAEVQSQLQSFYQTMMIWMAVIVCVITPALTAGTIPVERQRKSLDLLFSAPVSMKGLLVGKMISSYRYLWMLLVLSLPITSLCVVMGGASWSDVLSAYAMLSFAGIVMTAIGLLISSMTTSMAGAVLWTYLSVAGYLIVTGAFSASGASYGFMRDPTVLPWYSGINPFAAGYAGPSHCVIFDYNIPNWIPAGILAFLISKLCLLGAGSALSFHRAPETKRLRIYGLIYLFTIALGGSYALNVTSARFGGPSFTAGFIGIVTALMFFLMPHMYSYGNDSGQKYRGDGRFSFRNVFWSNPSGSLPYTILLWAVLSGGALLGQALSPLPTTSIGGIGRSGMGPSAPTSTQYVAAPYYMAIWSLAYLVMWWCIGRAISSRTNTLKAARTGFVGAMIVIIALPMPILSIINSAMSYQYYESGGVGGAWIAHIFYPLTSREGQLVSPIYAVCMLALGIGVLALERKKDVPPVVKPV